MRQGTGTNWVRLLWVVSCVVFVVVCVSGAGQVSGFVPVSEDMLLDPDPADWLMYSRTYDAQRFSPLDEINTTNVADLEEVWSNALVGGTIESIPIVHDGVMYAIVPVQSDGDDAVRTGIQALNAANGNLIWEYVRPSGGASRTKSLGIFEDMIIFASPDNYIVALDATNGTLRWETESTGGLSSGTIIMGDKVLSGRTCNGERANCYVAAHDARTGKELWRFYTAAGTDDPEGNATWGGAPEATRTASTWGLGGSYDAERGRVYWGVANPTPNTRAARHGGDVDAIARTAPADLYSNSTVSVDAETGELIWYYQHLPGDDWDQDYTNERILLTTRLDPDPAFVKWINPNIARGEQRDVVVNVGEGGGLFMMDRDTGEFLWANPFPYDGPNFLISDIDVETGRTTINWDVVLKEPGEQHVICAYNTKSYWPMAYDPENNSLYVPYVDDCLDMTRAAPGGPGEASPQARGAGRGRGGDGGQPERRTGVRRPGSDPERYGGIAKIDMATGEIVRIYEGRVPGNGAMLATAGNLLFWGDLDQEFRALDARTGEVLWQKRLGGPIQNSTITYAVDGKQYVAVMTGLGLMTQSLFGRAGIDPERNTAIHVFALPD